MTTHRVTADSPLPLDEFAEIAEVDQLRAALADVLTYIDNPTRPAPANRVRAWRALAGRPEVPGIEDTTAVERGLDGMTRAAAKWTDEEAAEVDTAIATVAARRKANAIGDGTPGSHGAALAEFTTADVWQELGPGFPVTKGIASKMLAAARAGLIANTGRHKFNDNPDRNHAHGQRLTVWKAL